MDEVEQIKERINIVDLVGEYLPLKKAGVNYKANCPFHSEHSPSFMVSPERGIWHCFGCQKGGDIFKFTMEKEGVEFKEALEILAQKAGVTLSKSSKKQIDPKDRLFEANQKAQQFFHYILTEHPLGKAALDYLRKRGLTNETIKTFGIGYAPQSWESLANFLKKRGFTIEEMVQSGLCVSSNRGGYDRFRGRIIFPLIDVRNRILGFSGRVLTTGEPKYINTPQTTLFDKSHFLFGIQLAKSSMREKKEAVLVEGEMDMIMSYQSGVKNIVASKGTALTEGQIELLKRYVESLNLCFDTDLAGDAASRRGIELADRAGLNLKVVKIEGAKDPAEICLADIEIWKKAVKDAIPIYDYYLNSAARRFDPTVASDKKSIFEELVPILQKISSNVVKEHYIQKLSALLQTKEEIVRKAVTSQQSPLVSSAQIMSTQMTGEINVKDRKRLLEEYLLALLLHIPEEVTYVPDFPETLFSDDAMLNLFVLLVLHLDSISFKGKSFKITELVQTLSPELVDLVDRLYLMQIDERLTSGSTWEKELGNVKQELKKLLIKSSLEKLSLQIKQAQEFARMDTLTVLNRKFRDLSLKLKNL